MSTRKRSGSRSVMRSPGCGVLSSLRSPRQLTHATDITLYHLTGSPAAKSYSGTAQEPWWVGSRTSRCAAAC